MTTTFTAAVERPYREQLTNIPLLRPVVCFDGGNRTIQWIDPVGQIRTIPSFIKTIDPTLQDATGDEFSVSVDFEGETFVVGQLAKDLGGTPIFQNEKTKLARKLVLAALEPNPGNDAVRVERLLIALPNSRNSQDVKALKAIEGTHDFTRNDRPTIATVRHVIPVDETQAAYTVGMQQGLYLSRKNPNGVLDLGGGTSILRLYSVSGTLMREADLILPGTYDLARRIAARITRDLASSPDLSLIMDGIEAGHFQLGTTGYNFSAAFETARAEWIEEIRGQIRTRWGQWLPSLGEVLIIGGSAPLAQPMQEASQGRFKIAPNPQNISIQGMGLL